MPGFLLNGLVAAVAVVGVAGKSADDLALVGSAGEVYERDATATETPTWRRKSGGGVAATLVSARGASVKDIWGLSTTAPPYRFDGTSWNASPLPMTGAAVMSTSGATAVAVARRVMVWSQGKWAQLPTTGANGILAVWAGGPKDALVATVDGDLKRFDGTAWKVITPKLKSTSERIRALQAGKSGNVMALGDEGSVLIVDKTSARAATVDTRVAAFVGRLGGQGSAGQAYLLGSATVDGKSRQVIGRMESSKLVLVDTLPALATDDAPVAMLVAGDGAIVVVTKQGVVHMRASGGAWTRGITDGTLPADTSHASNPPAVSAGNP